MRGGRVFVCGLLGLGIVAACSGPGSGLSTFAAGDVKAQSSGDDDDTTSSSSSSSSGAGTGVFGATTFAYKNPGLSANNQIAHKDSLPLQGKDCVKAGCHLETKPWAFAGTVFQKKADPAGVDGGGPTVPEAEIGVLYPDNKFRSAMTDPDGNFWIDGEPPPKGSKVAVRKAGGTVEIMNQALGDAPGSRACNSDACHGLATNRIYIE